MPVRSPGCFQCRKRKIRCDEGRPGCERCAKHGVPCPGYRREKGGLEFEDQTVITVRKAKKSYGEEVALVVKKSPSSSNSSTRSSTPNLRTQNSNRYAFQTWSLTLPPSILISPAANQAQLYDKWLNIYTPVTCGSQGLHFDYLREAIDMAESEPALRDGLNTLALVQVGHAFNDEHLLAASVPSYGRALASLAYAVSKATSVRDNTVLAAASLLVVCEFYDKIKTQGMSWFGHVEGVQQLLLARGPDSLDTNLSLILFYNARHASTARSFLLRKGDSYDTPAWRAAAFRTPIHDSSISLFDITIRVPRLLQRSDELDLASPQALQNVRDLLHDCERLEAEMRNWQTSFHSSLRNRGTEPYETVSVEHFRTFSRLVADRTLPTCHRFPNFMSGYLHSQFWVAIHYLRSTIKELREQRQNLDTSFQTDYSSSGGVTDEELNGYAFDLCRSIPHFVEPTSGTQGHIGIFLPLAVIMMHFKSKQNWKWCSWGVNVQNNVFSMGLRQPQVKQESLPVSTLRPRAGGLSPFPNSYGYQSPSPESEAKNEVSPESGTSSDGAGYVFDDLADVDLGIDWSGQVPGFTPAVQDVPEKGVGASVLELADDFLEFDGNLDLNLDLSEYSLG
jgi:hypothetical protein